VGDSVYRRGSGCCSDSGMEMEMEMEMDEKREEMKR
jgi:hypothetical protein